MSTTKNSGILDGLDVHGVLELDLVDESGAVLRTFIDKNLVVNSGLQLLSTVLATDVLNRIGVGTNGAAAAGGDVAPLANQWTKAFDSIDHPTADSTRFNFTIAANECNGMVIREFGLLFIDGETQVLFSRKGEKSIEKTSSFSIAGRWTITIN